MVKVKPADWAAAKATLTPAADVAGPYEAKMAADDFAGCAYRLPRRVEWGGKQ